MDLNNFELSNTIIADLYKKTLVSLGGDEVPPASQAPKSPALKKQTAPESAGDLKYLGENKKNILIVVNYPNAVHIPDPQLEWLTRVLGACGITLADVAICNLSSNPGKTFNEFIKHFKSRVVLLHGPGPAEFGMPVQFPVFQVQVFANSTFLYSPPLEEMEPDELLKSKLWLSLQRIFPAN